MGFISDEILRVSRDNDAAIGLTLAIAIITMMDNAKKLAGIYMLLVKRNVPAHAAGFLGRVTWLYGPYTFA